MTNNQVVIELFVQGQSPQSNVALEHVRRVCDTELDGQYSLEVIDINQHTNRAIQAGVIATPTLVRRRPEPILRTTGRLNNERVRQGLGLDE